MKISVKDLNWGGFVGYTPSTPLPDYIPNGIVCTPTGDPEVVTIEQGTSQVGAPVLSTVGEAVAGRGGGVRITGTALRGIRTVTVGDVTVKLSAVSSSSPTSASSAFFFAPALPAGSYPVVVHRPDGTSSAASSITYR